MQRLFRPSAPLPCWCAFLTLACSLLCSLPCCRLCSSTQTACHVMRPSTQPASSAMQPTTQSACRLMQPALLRPASHEPIVDTPEWGPWTKSCPSSSLFCYGSSQSPRCPPRPHPAPRRHWHHCRKNQTQRHLRAPQPCSQGCPCSQGAALFSRAEGSEPFRGPEPWPLAIRAARGETRDFCPGLHCDPKLLRPKSSLDMLLELRRHQCKSRCQMVQHLPLSHG